MTIKPAFLVTDMSLNAYDVNGVAREKKTEKAAIKAATDLLASNADEEVWVWKLSHVISRPDLEPDIEKVK